MFSMGTDNEEAETDLRAVIRLNPQFAPPYDRLAVLMAMRREDLDQAHMLNLQAIQLDPDNISYRMNAANVLEEMEKYKDAMNVLKTAAQLAHSDRDVAMVQSAMQRVESNQQRSAEVVAVASEEAPPAQGVVATSQVVDIAPKFATLPADGPRVKVLGIMQHVRCSYPNEIEFQVAGPGGSEVSLYNNDYTKIDLMAAANVQVKESMNPCSDFEGRTARVQYIKSQSQSVDGQVVSVELTK
jgi:tetratricopeptide (TPR) repeat protein